MAFKLVHAKYDRETERAYVELRDEDEDGGDVLVVDVRDDGRGAPAEGQDEGMGISGMRARVAELGGTLDVTPADDSGSGFVVRATLPDPA